MYFLQHFLASSMDVFGDRKGSPVRLPDAAKDVAGTDRTICMHTRTCPFRVSECDST